MYTDFNHIWLDLYKTMHKKKTSLFKSKVFFTLNVIKLVVFLSCIQTKEKSYQNIWCCSLKILTLLRSTVSL